jgi:hypothetical protein
VAQWIATRGSDERRLVDGWDDLVTAECDWDRGAMWSWDDYEAFVAQYGARPSSGGLAGVREPRRPRPPLMSGGIALSEPGDE